MGASRIDRIYISETIKSKKTGLETRAAAFTDQFAIIMRMSIDAPVPTRGRGYWKMNTSLMEDNDFRQTLKT
jgi:hypothetical protein